MSLGRFFASAGLRLTCVQVLDVAVGAIVGVIELHLLFRHCETRRTGSKMPVPARMQAGQSAWALATRCRLTP